MSKAEQRKFQQAQALVPYIFEMAQTRRGGSCVYVPATRVLGVYRVDLDEHYHPVACECQGGKYHCKHKIATTMYFADKISTLLHNETNPVYQFYRKNVLIQARLSQFTKAEKHALLEQQRLEQWEEEARQRAIFVALFDPCGLAGI